MNRRIQTIATITFFIFCMLMSSSNVFAFSIYPAVMGTVYDGTDGIKDGVGDSLDSSLPTYIFNTPDLEARTVLEFSVPVVSEPLESAWIDLMISSSQGPFDPLGWQINFFVGDGTLGFDDFDANNVFANFTYSGQSTLHLPALAIADTMQQRTHLNAGLNFRFPNEHQGNSPYVEIKSAKMRINEPALPHVVPEPSTFALFGSGVLGMFFRRRKRS